MTTVTMTHMLVIHKEVERKDGMDYAYLILRERTKPNWLPKFYPVVKFLKYNKRVIKAVLNLEIGDVVNIVGDLTNINVRHSVPELRPPFVKIRKTVVNIKDIEVIDHISGFEEKQLEPFIDIENDEFVKNLNKQEMEELENILDKKLMGSDYK